MQAFEKVSIMVSMESYPSEIGSLTMKSMATDIKGRVKLSEGMGNRGGLGFMGLFFHDWQRWQPLMYSVTVCFKLGHQ
jgi:hypothetical protein